MSEPTDNRLRWKRLDGAPPRAPPPSPTDQAPPPPTEQASPLAEQAPPPTEQAPGAEMDENDAGTVMDEPDAPYQPAASRKRALTPQKTNRGPKKDRKTSDEDEDMSNTRCAYCGRSPNECAWGGRGRGAEQICLRCFGGEE